jgi:LysM repeat protein
MEKPMPPTACTYTVKPGDMLGKIAADNGVTVGDMMKVNGITDPNLIHVGQTLQIPGCGQSMQPQPMPMAEQPTQMQQPMDQQQPMQQQPMMEQPMMEQPMAMDAQPMPARPMQKAMGNESMQPMVHVVKPGDTFSGICQRYGADQSQVAQMNGIGNPNYIVVGQEIVIP